MDRVCRPGDRACTVPMNKCVCMQPNFACVASAMFEVRRAALINSAARAGGLAYRTGRPGAAVRHRGGVAARAGALLTSSASAQMLIRFQQAATAAGAILKWYYLVHARPSAIHRITAAHHRTAFFVGSPPLPPCNSPTSPSHFARSPPSHRAPPWPLQLQPWCVVRRARGLHCIWR
jgi:hypothetical protein